MKVLFYKIEKIKKQEDIKKILDALDIELIEIKDQDVHQKIGYLVGLDGYTKEKVDKEELPYEMMVMFDFEDHVIDQLLALFKQAQIPFIPLKAMVTQTNVNWTLSYLQEHILDEYRRMSQQ